MNDWNGEIPIDGKPSPEFPKTVKLSWSQWYFAAQVGLMRYVASRQNNMQHKHGYDGHGLGDDIAAATAELAASLALGECWPALVNAFKNADLGNDIQVRYTKLTTGKLIIRNDDPKDHRYVLVIGISEREFRVVGWKWGFEARKDEWIEAPNGRPPAWFVPQQELDTW